MNDSAGAIRLAKSAQIEKTRDSIAVDFSADGNLAAIVCRDLENDLAAHVAVWSLREWKRVTTISGCSRDVEDVAFSRNGELLVCGGRTDRQFMGGEIAVWSTGTWKKTRTIVDENFEGVRRVSISPEARVIASGSACYDGVGATGKVRLWDPILRARRCNPEVHGPMPSTAGT